MSGVPLTFSIPSEALPAGKSAYELACDNGFTGSVVEWLASLSVQGPAGAAGPHQ